MEHVFLNGKRVGPEIPLRALLFGEGLFETFRYRYRLPVFLDRHYHRMERGAEMLGIPFIERDKFISLIDNAVSDSRIKDAYVKVCLFSRGGLNYFDCADDGDIAIVVKDYASRMGGVKVRISEIRRYSGSSIHRIKSLSYLENILARRTAIQNGYDEAIFLNEREEVAEGSSSNIFWIRGDTLFTPSIDCGILPGTTRELLVSSANQLGLKVEEGYYSQERVSDARCAFLTNSIVGSSYITHFEHTNYLPVDDLYESIKSLVYAELGWM